MAREDNAEISNDVRREQAADWLLRLRGDLTPIEYLQWEQWYAYPENREALELIQRISPIHGNLERPDLLRGKLVRHDEHDGSASVEEWVQKRSKRRSRTRIGYLRLAAAVVSVGLLSAVLFVARACVNAAE